MIEKLPKFKSVEEEAKFWDTHSPDDYGHWEEVEIEVAKPLKHVIVIDESTFKQISKIAKEKGLGILTLADDLLKKGLETENLRP